MTGPECAPCALDCPAPATVRGGRGDSSAPTGGSAEAPRLRRDRTAVSEGDSLGTQQDLATIHSRDTLVREVPGRSGAPAALGTKPVRRSG